MCVFLVINDLVLIPVHTKPTDSEKEIDELYDVCMAVREKWKTNVSENALNVQSGKVVTETVKKTC